MNVTLDPWPPGIDRVDSVPTISTVVPDDFLQHPISDVRWRRASPTHHAGNRFTRNVAPSDSSEIDSSSGGEVREKRRGKRERSEIDRSRSRSRSRHSRKRPRSHSRKYRRDASPGGAWVYVPSGESKRLHSPDSRSSERAPRLPLPTHSLEPLDLPRRKDLAQKHKSSRPPVHPAQRGETSFFEGSLTEPAQLVRSSSKKDRFPLSDQPIGTVTSASRALGKPRALPEPVAPALQRDPPSYGAPYGYRSASLDPRGGRPVYRSSNPAPPRQAEASADGGEAPPSEDSAYRRVVGLIRRLHGIA
ncbi:arginine/serine-rich protein 1-like [Palaemon carinicauda]|uniref:arginine/serine-rich protein 1-like n=1 Tax=Palaemon carinicauda TaxID=392227 RepID=UPI0035B6917C